MLEQVSDNAQYSIVRFFDRMLACVSSDDLALLDFLLRLELSKVSPDSKNR